MITLWSVLFVFRISSSSDSSSSTSTDMHIFDDCRFLLLATTKFVMDYRQLATIICLRNPCHAVSPLTQQLELPRVHLHTQTLTNRQFVKSGMTRDWTLSHWIRLESNRVSGFACATTALLTRWILTTELRSLWPTMRSRVAVPEPLQGKGCYPLIPYKIVKYHTVLIA